MIDRRRYHSSPAKQPSSHLTHALSLSPSLSHKHTPNSLSLSLSLRIRIRRPKIKRKQENEGEWQDCARRRRGIYRILFRKPLSLRVDLTLPLHVQTTRIYY
jgi:hypothetical protein